MPAEGGSSGRSPLSAVATDISAAPAIMAVLGRQDATLSVPERAQPAALAALARSSGRRPLVVCAVSDTAAENLAADLRSWLGHEAVASLPAWETLPFERISPTAAATTPAAGPDSKV